MTIGISPGRMWEMKKLERSMSRAGDQTHWRELAAVANKHTTHKAHMTL